MDQLNFLQFPKFENPKSTKQAISRMHANIPYFSVNYMVIFVLLMIFTIITSPYLLFCSVGILYGWTNVMKMERIDIGPLKLQGKSKIISFSVCNKKVFYFQKLFSISGYNTL